MPRFQVHFAADAHEPFPPLDTLPTIEADDPIAAVQQLVSSGRVPQNRPVAWARVVLSVHENGQPRKVVRVPIDTRDSGRLAPAARSELRSILTGRMSSQRNEQRLAANGHAAFNSRHGRLLFADEKPSSRLLRDG